MDDFGVLVQTFGIRPQGKSAPMAASKAASRTHNYNQDPPFSTIPSSKSNPNLNSGNGSLLDDQIDSLGFGFTNHKPQSYANVDTFQMPSNGGAGGLDFDIEAVLKGSMNSNTISSDVDDNTIWGFSGQVSSNGAVDGGDLLSSDPVDDYLGNLGKIGSGSSLNAKKGSKVDTDYLIPGFGTSSSTNNRAQTSSTKSSSGSSSIDELDDFVSGSMKKKANGNLDGFKINIPKQTFKTKSVEPNFIDIDIDLEGIGGGSVHQGKVESVSQNTFEAEAPDLDSFFGVHSQKSKPVSEETTRNGKTEEVNDLFSGTPVSTKKNISPENSHNDFLFFGVASTSTQFEEFEGESKERRSARFAHYQSTQARMAGALADLNEREFRAQQEQEERYRIAEAMDMEIKHWAKGKEGKLRALLSSLEQVLAPELGWKAVTLTDLITSSQVKIAYKKAALCVHPDKVQQKGANLQQKYVAEKVFDLLKEAWNKFNSEELQSRR